MNLMLKHKKIHPFHPSTPINNHLWNDYIPNYEICIKCGEIREKEPFIGKRNNK